MKKIPKFKNEDAERKFWATRDSTEYIDWSKARRAVFPRLKPSTRSISLRLPEFLLNQLRVLANKRDVPYQSLMKIFLSERIEQEIRSLPHGASLCADRPPRRPRGRRQGTTRKET